MHVNIGKICSQQDVFKNIISLVYWHHIADYGEMRIDAIDGQRDIRTELFMGIMDKQTKVYKTKILDTEIHYLE